jgi:hypothetical protein
MKNLLLMLTAICLLLNGISAQPTKSPCEQVIDQRNDFKDRMNSAVAKSKNEYRRRRTAEVQRDNAIVRAKAADDEIRIWRNLAAKLSDDKNTLLVSLGNAYRLISKMKDTMQYLNGIIKIQKEIADAKIDSFKQNEQLQKVVTRQMGELGSRLDVDIGSLSSSKVKIATERNKLDLSKKIFSKSGGFFGNPLDALIVKAQWLMPRNADYNKISEFETRILVYQRDNPKDTTKFVTSVKTSIKQMPHTIGFLGFEMSRRVLPLQKNLEEGKNYVFALVHAKMLDPTDTLVSYERLCNRGKIILGSEAGYFRDFDRIPKSIESNPIVLHDEPIYISNGHLSINIFDGKEADKDSVEISFNGGKPIVYELPNKQNQPLNLKFECAEHENILLIRAKGSGGTDDGSTFELKCQSNGKNYEFHHQFDKKGVAFAIRVINQAGQEVGASGTH